MALGLRVCASDAPPGFGVAVGHYGVHGIAVSKKDCGHQFLACESSSIYHGLSWLLHHTNLFQHSHQIVE